MSHIKEHYAELIERGIHGDDPIESDEEEYPVEQEEEWVEPEDDDAFYPEEEPPADLFAP